MNLVALGRAAINIASSMQQKFSQYDIFNIGLATDGEDMFIKIGEKNKPEDYENLSVTNIKKLKKIRGSVMFFVCGTSTTAPASLVVLEQLVKNKCEVSVVYIKPDVEFVSEIQKTQERVVRCVLQEYARSMLLREVIIFDNMVLDQLVQPAPISRLRTEMNEHIVSVLHWYNIFKNTKPVFEEVSETSIVNRIVTFGVVSLDDSEIKTFYDLKNITDMRYYFSMNKEKLEDPNLRHEIINLIRGSKKSNCSGYSVFENFGPENFGILVFYSSEPESS